MKVAFTKSLLLLFLASFTLNACAQVESLLAGGMDTGVDSSPVASATQTETPGPSNTPTVSPTATISPTPTLTLTPRPTRTPRSSYTPSVTVPALIRMGPDNFPAYVNPLTGRPVTNPMLLERRPLAVKLALFPLTALPPSGVTSADHVYEYYLEGGLSRWVAIFYGENSSRVGPVRSARIFDEQIVRMYNAALVFSGAHQDEGSLRDVYGYLEDRLNVNLFIVDPGTCEPYLCRDERIYGYNNLFGDTGAMTELINQRYVDNDRPALGSLFFNTLGGRSKFLAERVYIQYSFQSYAYWAYDANTGRYWRHQGSSYENKTYIPLVDRFTNLPIAYENVVVLFAPHDFYYKSSDTEIFDIQLAASGQAYIFRDGLAYPARWERTAKDKPLTLYSELGGYFPMKPGKTFFQVISTDSIVVQSSPNWEFFFVRPELE